MDYDGWDALGIFKPNKFVYYYVEDLQKDLYKIKYLIDYPEANNAVLKEPSPRYVNRTIEKYFSFCDDIGGINWRK